MPQIDKRRGYKTLLALILGVALAGAVGTARAAGAQWPTHPVTFVVPFGAGGSTDGVARLIAKHLSDDFGQQFIVENKPGAGGNIAGAYVAKAAPDGYTLFFATTGPAAVNKLLYKRISFNPDKDYAPVVLIGIVPQAIVASKKLPVKTLKDLIDYARAHPGALTFGNSGVGTMAHISAVSLAQATGIKVTHVSYRSGAQALQDVLGGQIDVAFPAYIPQVAQMNTLAVIGKERLASLPNVPTVRETGVADIVAGTWFGVIAPTGTPPEVIAKINTSVNAFLKTQQAKQVSIQLGMQTLGGTPQDMKKFMDEETARWAPVIKKENISLN